VRHRWRWERASRYPYSADDRWEARSAGECPDQLATSPSPPATERWRLLSSVMVVPQRHPLRAGKMLASRDVLFRGRLILGCGAGWMKEKFEALGAPPSSCAARRSARLSPLFKALGTQALPTFPRYVGFENVAFAQSRCCGPTRAGHAPGRWVVVCFQQPAASFTHTRATRRGRR